MQALAQAPARQTTKRTIDVLGTVLFAVSIASFMVALTLLGNNPAFVSSPIFWLLLVGSVVVLAAFVWQEKRRETRSWIWPRSCAGRSWPSTSSVS